MIFFNLIAFSNITYLQYRQDADGRKFQHHYQQVVCRENFLHQRATRVVLGRDDRWGECAGVHRPQPGVHESVSDGRRRRQHIGRRPQASAVTTFQLAVTTFLLAMSCNDVSISLQSL